MIKIQEKCYEIDNYYNKDIYNDYIEDIQTYINTYQPEEYSKILEQDKRTNIMMIFSEMKSNIIKWYPFEYNKKILEIGANYGEITQELVKMCGDVTSIEFSKEKVECIKKRLDKSENLNIILTSNLKELKLEEKYDYVTLIGTSEYAEKLGFKNLKEMLSWAFTNLNENGRVLLAIDNKFGVKYLAGATRNKDEAPFANYKTYINKDYKLYGKTELEDILRECAKTNYKFYYPVPNYNLTHLIYTDDYLPKNNRYNIYYREDEEILFNELTLINEIIKNKKFDFFTNSYLIEIIAENNNLPSNINFVNYSNMRQENYKIITKLSKEIVTKEAYKEEGQQHIEQVSENIQRLKELDVTICEEKVDNKIISKYIDKIPMDIFMKKLLDGGKISTFIEELDKWYNFIKDKFQEIKVERDVFDKFSINIEQDKKEKLIILKHGFIDAIFQNVFYEGDGYILFDQEWYEEAVPLEFIMYRSIKQLFFQNSELENLISKEEIYERYNIKDYIDEFEMLENEWQKNMVNEAVLNFYSEKWNRIISIEDIKYNFNQQLGKVYLEKDELEIKNKNLEEQINKLQKELDEIKNTSKLELFMNNFRKKKGC